VHVVATDALMVVEVHVPHEVWAGQLLMGMEAHEDALG